MRNLVRNAMREGALGVGSSLIYAPANFADTDELIALVSAAAEFGGAYISHIRSEGNELETYYELPKSEWPADGDHIFDMKFPLTLEESAEVGKQAWG